MFYHCEGLKGQLTIPSKVNDIGQYAFGYCQEFSGSLIIPNSVMYISDYAFEFCGFDGQLNL